jgi:hypothetical protein
MMSSGSNSLLIDVEVKEGMEIQVAFFENVYLARKVALRQYKTQNYEVGEYPSL